MRQSRKKRGKMRIKRSHKKHGVGFEVTIAVIAGMVMFGSLGFILPYPGCNPISGALVGAVLGGIFPKTFFAVGDAILTALI
ncbi:MAG: hypothetical protein AAGF67_11860 [Verrucomicrobiota bacterium]